MEPVKERSAIVVGGSHAGLLAANLLHRAGWDVDVYDRSPTGASGGGAGIITHPELVEVLGAAGCPVGPAFGIPISGRVVLDREGRIVAERPLPQVMSTARRVLALLREAFPVERLHGDHHLSAIVQEDHGVHARFANGARASAQLLVAADGTRSQVRAMLFPDAKPEYAGYIAWRGLVDMADLPAAARSVAEGRIAIALPPREQALGYPVPGVHGPQFNALWYRPLYPGERLAELLTDAEGVRHPHGIAPDQIRPELVRALQADAAAILPPPFRDAFARMPQPFFQQIYDLEPSRIVMGRVALVGDAAFVARPHTGLGVTKAALDAAALVAAVEAPGTTVPGALIRYNAARIAFGRAVVARGRTLGEYLHAQIGSESERAAAERSRSAEATLRDTAVSLADALKG
jgi:2-polyprenyl-6-methoxyphenol hydroxylase-like FAD-dependent oxidoreductase